MIRAVLTIGALQFLTMVLMLARTKILAVTLGPSAVGTMSVIDKLTAMVAQTISLSLPFAALRFLPSALRESPESMDLLYRRMRGVILTLVIPATVICITISIGAPARWGVALLPHQRVVTLAFAGLPVIALAPFLTSAFAGGMGHARSMRFSIAHAGVMLLAAVAAGIGLGLSGYYGVYAVLGVALMVVGARRVMLGARAGRRALSPVDVFRLPAVVWRFSGALIALTFAAPYAALFVQYTTLRLYGAAASGILQSAIGVSLSVRALLGTAHAVFLTPHVNRQADTADRMAWANGFQRTTVLLFVIVLPPLLLFADVALRLLYSGRFVGASSFVALFVAAEVVTLLSGTYQALIIAGDRMLFHVVQNLAAQALLAGIAAIALPRIGLAGAGLATLAAPLFLFGTTLTFLRRRFAVRVSREAAMMALLTATLLLACGTIGSRYPGLSPGRLGAKLAFCGGVWLASYLVMPAEDRARLRYGAARVKQEVMARTAQHGGRG
ncbi:MAG: hypothetical protein ACRELE_00495 [Gemmatimonadales bacterium]